VLLVGAGYAAGYFYNNYKLMSEMYSSIILRQEISDAKFNYALVKLLDEERYSQASEILKVRMYTNLFVFDDFTSSAQSDEMKKEVGEVFSKISEHHEKYPYKFGDGDFDSKIDKLLSSKNE